MEFGLFLTAAIVLAITPGPGIFYVLTRSLRGGRMEGYASSVGTAVGGLGHVFAAALGLSAILAASSVAFTVVKYAGAAYLVYLGVRTLMQRNQAFEVGDGGARDYRQAFRQGIVTEILNPKTALFFLAFIPQFVDPSAALVPQFLLLGCIVVLLNTSVDFVVATLTEPIRARLQDRAGIRAVRTFSGVGMIALGAYVAFAGGEASE